ncbi:hypothetical protein T492DRAFT_527185 [Pavlovales sp. CCMP2436]|nr:hypothetical protein T492DRAFT_527185 [Pavlovales sp. CCMP2436]
MQAVQLLGRFISIREANIRYLGLETMAKLSQHPECADDVKRHNSTILFRSASPAYIYETPASDFPGSRGLARAELRARTSGRTSERRGFEAVFFNPSSL